MRLASTFLITATMIATAAPALAGPVLQVAKSPSCGCCAAWIAHMREAGFEVEAHDLSQDALDAAKARLGVPEDAVSCHTGRIAGYVVEGHVPALDVMRLIAEGPDVRGISVPGMPIGSPGMEMGEEREPYDSMLIGHDGALTPYESHR